jgi:hypothetical protein
VYDANRSKRLNHSWRYLLPSDTYSILWSVPLAVLFELRALVEPAL